MSDIFKRLFHRKESATSSKPTPDPPKGDGEIDWKNWSPPQKGDVRSPCPALNALANHNILPHNGKNITKAMAVKALTNPGTIHLSPHIAAVFASGAVSANPDHHAHSFDLDHVDKHGLIEHDVSLSRNDVALGSNSTFDHEHWKKVYAIYSEGGSGEVNYERASKARYARVRESKQAHAAVDKVMEYGLKEAILSYGESALLMNVFGKDGVVPLEYLRVFVEEERLPVAEGWRPPTKTIEQSMMNKAIFELVAANEHKGEEAVEIGLGTIHALESAIESLMKTPSMCSVM